MTSMLKKLIPRQNFEVDIQGAIGAKIISRATIKPYRNERITPKDVQYVLGHKTSKTAMEIYTHVTKKQKKDIKGSIDNLNF